MFLIFPACTVLWGGGTRHSKIAILAIKISMKNSKKTSRDDIQGGVIQISR